MERWILALAAFAVATAQTPFKATAELGKPTRVGAIARVIGTNEEMDYRLLKELTLDSATLAYTFPNAAENIVAGANEKLLVMRGQLRNLSKAMTVSISGSSAIGFRLTERYTGTGKFQFVRHFDPDTLKNLEKSLKPGEAGSFVGVWRIPADFKDFRFGITTERATIIPWYDLRPSIGKLSGVFATVDGLSLNPSATVRAGTRFEMDGIDMAVSNVNRPAQVGPYVTDASKPVLVVTVQATNKMMLPVRWGWQYFTAELIGASGPLKAYPELIDRATSRTWAGDLAAGASVETHFLFYPSGAFQPTAFRLKVNETGRSVDVTF